jgi:two-component sensor histidine kinase/PAS domain-containing protein
VNTSLITSPYPAQIESDDVQVPGRRPARPTEPGRNKTQGKTWRLRNNLKESQFAVAIPSLTETLHVEILNLFGEVYALQADTDISASSKMAALIRAKDWSKTTLGDPACWPSSLTLVVNLLLASGFPMAVRWGPDFILIYNDGYRPILGDKHPRALGLPFREVWPEVQTQLLSLHESILSGERSAFFQEDLLLRIQRHGSQWEDARFTISYSPIPDDSAATGVGGVLITVVETTNRVLLEETLRKSEERYQSAMHLGRIGSWEVDFVKQTRSWTREGMMLFGIDLPDGLGQIGGQSDEFYQAMFPEDRHLLGEYHAMMNNQDSFPAEYRILKPDGQIRWLAGYGRVIDRQPNGMAHRVINVATDITERKASEAHQRFLLQELSHRSKNLLTIVQSIANQSLRNSKDQKDFQNSFNGRLSGLAASNDLLARGDWRGSSLRELMEFQLAPFIDLSSPQLEIRGPQIVLAADASQAIGLALHELATNAVKYGALSSSEGRLSVSWAVDQSPGAGGLKLDWRERGGPLVIPPKHKGFGHVVIKRMIEQAVLGSVELDFAKEGLHWSLRAPGSVFLS